MVLYLGRYIERFPSILGNGNCSGPRALLRWLVLLMVMNAIFVNGWEDEDLYLGFQSRRALCPDRLSSK